MCSVYLFIGNIYIIIVFEPDHRVSFPGFRWAENVP